MAPRNIAASSAAKDLSVGPECEETWPFAISIQRIRPEKKEKRRRRSSACRDLIWSLLFKGDQRVSTAPKNDLADKIRP